RGTDGARGLPGAAPPPRPARAPPPAPRGLSVRSPPRPRRRTARARAPRRRAPRDRTGPGHGGERARCGGGGGAPPPGGAGRGAPGRARGGAGGAARALPLLEWSRAAGLGDGLLVTGALDLPSFVRHLVAADVVLALRFPTYGEISGALVRALGVGRPVLVT